MAWKCLPGCKESWCPDRAVDDSGYCAKHKAQHTQEYERRRGSSQERGYGPRWRAAARAFLEEHYYQCNVPGCPDKATEVDHVIPHRGNMELFWDRSNWQCLCHAHHSSKTATENGRWAKREFYARE